LLACLCFAQQVVFKYVNDVDYTHGDHPDLREPPSLVYKALTAGYDSISAMFSTSSQTNQ
jgi:hypothetical protein